MCPWPHDALLWSRVAWECSVNWLIGPTALAFHGLLAPQPPHFRTPGAAMALSDMDGYSVETGIQTIWDPLGIAPDDEDELTWFRQAELKHGRVSMLATIGYVVAKTGICFPGAIALDGTKFSDLVTSNPFTEWDALPAAGKIQIFTIAAFLELQGEQSLIDGGKVGEIPFVKKRAGAAYFRRTEEQLASSRLAELKNGRLAMVGIAGFYAAEYVPGSVPIHF